MNNKMIIIDNFNIYNIENAIRGMRNPLQSWYKSDSFFVVNSHQNYTIGPNDLELAVKLCKSGSEHRKFIRQIFISYDLTAPEYFWKEYHTVKVGTVENSTSTMHTITKRELTFEDFSIETRPDNYDIFKNIVDNLNNLIRKYQKEENINLKKIIWRTIIQMLPMSFNYTKTCTLNYENLRNIYHQRKNHKLQEWLDYCDYMKNNILYFNELIEN